MSAPDSFECVDGFKTCAALEGFTDAEKESLIEEAWGIIGARDQEQRERAGRLYLAQYADRPSLWDIAFSSWPQLENELTPEQRALWAQAQAECRGRRAVAQQRTKSAMPDAP